MKANFLMKLFTLLLFFILLAGCGESQSTCNNYCLIRIGERIVTIADFNRELEFTKTAYPPHMMRNPTFFKETCLRLINQMLEKMILLEMAKTLNIQVSENEIQTAVQGIKGKYSQETFKQELIEQAISYNTWKSKLKERLLMKKVIETALRKQISLSENEISEYYENYFAKTTDQVNNQDKTKSSREHINETVARLLRMEKTEQAYKAWMADIRKNFKVQVNEDLWKKIISQTEPVLEESK